VGLLQSASELLLPSLSATFGIVILEAWAAGTVPISARTSGPAALIQHGHNGWLFDLDKPEAFHQALDATLAQPSVVRPMVDRGARLAQDFGVEALAERLKLLYQHLIEEKQCTM